MRKLCFSATEFIVRISIGTSHRPVFKYTVVYLLLLSDARVLTCNFKADMNTSVFASASLWRLQGGRQGRG